MNIGLWIVLVGGGATIVMDMWALLLKRMFGISSLGYGLVGRWIGHMPHRFAHVHIGRAEPVARESAIGWTAHYVTGIGFAATLPLLGGTAWMADPTPGLALGIGLATVAAPFLVMQPAFGFGIAASKTAAPAIARLKSLATHLVFGFGLYLAALAALPLTV